MSLPLAVTAYDFSLFLHITAVMVGFGATFAESIMFPVAMRAGVRHLPYVHRLQLAINQYMAGPAMLVIIATGFYQVAEGDWELAKFWLSGTIVIVLIVGALLGAYFIPTDRRLGPMVAREIDEAGDRELKITDLSAQYQREGRREGMIGALTGVLLIVAVYLMVIKPGL
jgi:Predicted integral membrane protein (DUF2269)